ncbi:MAG TPA: hypothetical protein VIH59_19745 [Candidatus Tectomicrobia bacterium]|jgi:hypothetical protein
MSLHVLDPTAEEMAVTTIKPGRLTTLAGCTIGLLDNGKLHVHELLNHVEALLRLQYGVAHIRRFKKPDASRPAPAALILDMQQCQAMISAVGD